MTDDDTARRAIRFWLETARESLASARSELAAGRLRFAVNRACYACFYAASASLLKEGMTFARHTGVRAALHKRFERTGRLDRTWGELYDMLFRARHEADYGLPTSLDHELVADMINRAEGFLFQMESGLAG